MNPKIWFLTSMCLLFETHNDSSTKAGQEGVVWTLTMPFFFAAVKVGCKEIF